MNINYVHGVMGKALPLTEQKFNELLDSKEIADLARGLADGTKTADDKKRGAAVCWQCSYRDGKRSNENAIPNGLFGIDIDAKDFYAGDDPDKLWERIKPHIDDLGIVVVHRSISGNGMHIVALCRPGFTTIAENQAWLAQYLHTGYDTACHDWARCFILAPRDYFYFVDNDIFNL